jgi:hypothetical protein
MVIPSILGLSVPIWGGIVLFLLIVFQILSGMRKIKVPPKTHKIIAFVLLGFGIMHAIVGVGIWFGWFSLG